MEEKISAIIIILILLSLLGSSPPAMGGQGSLSDINTTLGSEEIRNISIEGDDELRKFADKRDLYGNGSQEAPYELTNLTIDGMGENYSVYLENIELHFVIKNCKIYNSSESGIKINRVANFTLENNFVKNSTHGISILSSENITIKESNIYDTTNGINIISSENIIIKNSSIFENDRGVSLREGTNNNTITNNNISNNDIWGVQISESNNNLIYHNIFFENEIQAHDEGDNQWDRGEKGGNYWSDYENRYPKANESIYTGVWDTPYEILPEDDNEDGYPLISPIGPPTNFRVHPVRDEYVEITWDSPRYSIRYPVEEIILYRGKERENLSVYATFNSSVREFRDEDVNETETYHYGLKASNENHVSVMSEISSAQPDTTLPEVENVYPMGEDAPIDPTIKVEFSEEMIADSIQIFMEDDDGENIELEEMDEDPDDIEFYFVPKENLSYETRYEVSVNGSDKASNWLESPYTWSFTTISDTGMIRGRVVNEEGEALENVKIYVDEDHQTFTNDSGGFQLEVPSGNITIEFSREGYENKEKEFQINQSDLKIIEEDIVLREQEGIISRWFWPMAFAGGGILLLGVLALLISFYHWEEEEPPLDDDIYDIDYEDVDQEEFESWWEDEDS